MSLQELEISEHIHIMETYYDLNALLEDQIDNQSIATYYKHSDFFYNLIHSRGGHSIHMAISDDGFFKNYVGDMRRYFDELLFKDVSFTDLSEKIRPPLRRLDRKSCYYFTHPRLMKIMRRFISEDVTMNSIAGWLMLLTIDGTNIHKFCRIIATK